MDAADYSARVVPYLPTLVGRDLAYIERRFQYRFCDEEMKTEPESFVERARQCGIAVDPADVSEDEFDRWFREMDYDTRFPDYTKTYPTAELRRKKALEHFLSLKLSPLCDRGVVIDAGGCTSPFCRIVRRCNGRTKAYHLDLPRPELGIRPGVHGDVIGASADEIPLKRGSVDRVYSHNAIEHFEGGTYFRFITEAARVLRPGGRLCVLPLFVANETFAYTSINAWYKNKCIPAFRREDIVVLREDIQQPYSLHVSAETIQTDIVQPHSEAMSFRITFFENYRSVPRCFPFALVGTRR